MDEWNDEIKQNLRSKWNYYKKYYKITHNTNNFQQFIELDQNTPFYSDIWLKYHAWRTNYGTQKIFANTSGSEAYIILVNKQENITKVLYSNVHLDVIAYAASVSLFWIYAVLVAFVALICIGISIFVSLIVIGLSFIALYFFIKEEENTRLAQVLFLLRSEHLSLFEEQ